MGNDNKSEAELGLGFVFEGSGWILERMKGAERTGLVTNLILRGWDVVKDKDETLASRTMRTGGRSGDLR